jgi:hypothetical protein
MCYIKQYENTILQNKYQWIHITIFNSTLFSKKTNNSDDTLKYSIVHVSPNTNSVKLRKLKKIKKTSNHAEILMYR